MKNKKRLLLITTIICLLPILLSITLYDKLPNLVAIHFNAAGEANNYAPKYIAAFGLPVLMAVLNIIPFLAINNDQRKENSPEIMKQLCLWIIPLLSITLNPITLFKALGANIPINIIVSAILGILFIIMGNYLPKCKQNKTIGIRLPWTLESTDNWNKTHHFSGYLWILGGIIITISTFLNIKLAAYVLFITIAIMVIAPTIYSYRIYKTK